MYFHSYLHGYFVAKFGRAVVKLFHGKKSDEKQPLVEREELQAVSPPALVSSSSAAAPPPSSWVVFDDPPVVLPSAPPATAGFPPAGLQMGLATFNVCPTAIGYLSVRQNEVIFIDSDAGPLYWLGRKQAGDMRQGLIGKCFIRLM